MYVRLLSGNNGVHTTAKPMRQQNIINKALYLSLSMCVHVYMYVRVYVCVCTYSHPYYTHIPVNPPRQRKNMEIGQKKKGP